MTLGAVEAGAPALQHRAAPPPARPPPAGCTGRGLAGRVHGADRGLMKFKVEFLYKSAGRERPLDYVQQQGILFEHGEFVPIPTVSDSVDYLESEYLLRRGLWGLVECG